MGEAFSVGSRVSACGLACEIVEVVPLGAQTLLRLRCMAGDLAGHEWGILHPAETVTFLRAELRPEAPGPLDRWKLLHQAHLLDQVLGPADVLLAHPGRLRIEPYQLVPLMRALEMPRPRLLIADGVGLGKTVEAGLIVCELVARRRVHRVLVVSPPGPLLVQWAQEFRHRFALRFTPISNAAELQEQRRKLEMGGNPFGSIALCLTSLEFAKQERVLEELERSTWDMAIVDEAHHCFSASTGSDREDTQRRRLAEVVASRSDGLLLLTATPHDGSDAHFASLLELLDPSLTDGRGGVSGNAYRRHVVRRLKSHLHDARTGAPLFRTRRVIPVKVEMAGAALQPVRQFHQALAALIAPRLRRASRGRGAADALAFVSLLKRSGSTIGSCVATLRVVADRYREARYGGLETMRRERERALRAYRRRLLRFGVLGSGDESELADLEADGMAADLQSFAATELLRLTKATETLEALDTLIAFGEETTAIDPKPQSAKQEIRAIRAAHPAANILVYTEYADSQAALVQVLRKSIDGKILAINGDDSEAERSRVAECFAQEDGIVLVSTDSLAEGLNLHERCFNLIHLDLPYNPNRLEQRNGRIDRYGQQRDPEIRYLYLAGTFEERLLLHLIQKYERARAHLTFMPDTLAVTADGNGAGSGLIAGFAERQASLFDDEPVEIRTIDREAEAANSDAYRDLLREIDRAFAGFDRSAVRYGWQAEPPPIGNTDQGGTHLPASAESIDLPDFVASVIAAKSRHRRERHGILRIPSDWQSGLDGLPGFDPATGSFRFTRDHAQLRDWQGRSLGTLGRAHPLVRRAIAQAQMLTDDAHDCRVATARGDPRGSAAVLFTYSIELRSAARLEFLRTIAVLLREHGEALELEPPERWLPYAEPARAVALADAWQRLFAGWVPRRQCEAWSVAEASMRHEVDRCTGLVQQRTTREELELQEWLRHRADEICGAHQPATKDLFGAAPQGPDWRFMSAPLDRLAGFAADSDNPLPRRREAGGAVELFQRRSKELAAHVALATPMLHPVGMLMLVPAAPA